MKKLLVCVLAMILVGLTACTAPGKTADCAALLSKSRTEAVQSLEDEGFTVAEDGTLPGVWNIKETETLEGKPFAVSLLFDIGTDLMYGFRKTWTGDATAAADCEMVDKLVKNLTETYGEPSTYPGLQNRIADNTAAIAPASASSGNTYVERWSAVNIGEIELSVTFNPDGGLLCEITYANIVTATTAQVSDLTPANFVKNSAGQYAFPLLPWGATLSEINETLPDLGLLALDHAEGMTLEATTEMCGESGTLTLTLSDDNGLNRVCFTISSENAPTLFEQAATACTEALGEPSQSIFDESDDEAPVVHTWKAANTTFSISALQDNGDTRTPSTLAQATVLEYVWVLIE